MRVFQTKWFARWAGAQGLTGPQLCKAVIEMETGLVDAVLGASLVKKRIAGSGRGKSGSYRTIIAYRAAACAFFLYGFAKNERENIDRRELDALKKLAKVLLEYDDSALTKATKDGALLEVQCDEQDT